MKKLVLLLLLSFAATGTVCAQSVSRDTPAAKQFQAWLAAFNSGDRATLKEFLEKNRPSAVARLDDQLEFRNRTGGFELKKPEAATATSFTALVKEGSSEQFARIALEVEPEAPYHISKLEIRAIPTPPEFAVARLTEADALAALRAYLDQATAADHFSGAALVAHNGTTILEQAYGLADRAKKTPNQLNTKFRIGSMNKMFTAVSVMQLVQAGKINLTDPLAKYLPDYANKDLAAKVTIHQLLTHTGGTGDFFGPEFEAHRLELKTLNDYVKLYEKRPLQFEPGSKWEYSNFGYLLLGVVIEKASGQDYYDYVREHVFKPARMTSTDSLSENENVALRSVGYMKENPDSPWTPNTDTLPYRGTSAGGGYSTVGDLMRFALALENNKLLDAEHTKLVLTGKVDRPGGEQYAYGFRDVESGGIRCYGHGGGAPGMNGDLTFCPQSGYIVTVLSNLDPPAAQRPVDYLLSRLPMPAAKPN
jgi:D-alanyl-D-alanine carboxypeptidase